MKNKTFGKHGAAALVFALAVSGCAQQAQVSGKIIDEEPVSSGSAASGGSVGLDSGSAVSGAPVPVVEDDERQINTLLRKRAVYFDYDKSIVGPKYLPLIEAHAGYLLRNPDRGVLLEGNTDSRGSTEYNLALGQRRANAVRDIMSAGGVSDSQLEALSYGEGEPRALGSTEAAWAENRRVDIRYRDE